MSSYYIEISIGTIILIFLVFRFFGKKMGVSEKSVFIINILLLVFIFGVIGYILYAAKSYVGLFALFLGLVAAIKIVYDKLS